MRFEPDRGDGYVAASAISLKGWGACCGVSEKVDLPPGFSPNYS